MGSEVGGGPLWVVNMMEQVHPDVDLLREANQVGEHPDMAVLHLHLTQYNVTGLQRCANRKKIALRARMAQNGRVADDAITSRRGCSQVRNDGVGQSIGETVEVRVAGFVIESGHGHPGHSRWGDKPEAQGAEAESKRGDRDQGCDHPSAIPPA